MSDLKQRIDICKQTRRLTAEVMAGILSAKDNLSEILFRDKICEKLLIHEIYSHGWYEPPPFGISALFASQENTQRLLYDNLRKEEFWPQDQSKFSKDSIGLLYASPIDKLTGIIGDFGLTIYNGNRKDIQEHIKHCLSVVEQAADYSQVGMEFREINAYAQKLLQESGLNNNRTTPITGKFAKTIGHTVPWSHEEPNMEETVAIENQNFDVVKEYIRTKRINLDEGETFKVPPTIAFTTEIRAESNTNPNLPNVFFHLIVTFVDGKKEILGNFNPVFKAVGMDFIKSKY